MRAAVYCVYVRVMMGNAGETRSRSRGACVVYALTVSAHVTGTRRDLR